MKLYLIRAISKKGNTYSAIATKRMGRTIYLTFDTMTVLKVTGYNIFELESLACGEYEIKAE